MRRLGTAWQRLDQHAPPMTFPNPSDVPVVDPFDGYEAFEWAPVSSILGEGGDEVGWGRFSYRSEMTLILAERFLCDADELRGFPVQGARLDTPYGPLYWVTMDGLHRLATAKAVGLPYLPFECGQARYEIGGLVRAGLRWQAPQLAVVPDRPARSLWSRILRPHAPDQPAHVHERKTEGWERVGLWRILLEEGHLHGDLARMLIDGEVSVVLRIDPSSPRPWLLRELGFLRTALHHAYPHAAGLDLRSMADLGLPPLPRRPDAALEGIPCQDVYEVVREPVLGTPPRVSVGLRTAGSPRWDDLDFELPPEVRCVTREADDLTPWVSQWSQRGVEE